MNLIMEPSVLGKLMFNDKLLDSLLEAYTREMDTSGFTAAMEEYALDRKALSSSLCPEQLSLLDKAEALCRENICYAVDFSFFQGCRGFFQELFSGRPMEQPFQVLAVKTILTLPGMAQHSNYYSKRQSINRLFKSLSQALSPQMQEYITSVESYWDERLYGAVRHAFYLGYRRAMASVENSGEFLPPRSYSQMLSCLEHELDLE